MSTAKSILGIVPGLQATALVGQNLRFVNESFRPRSRRNYNPMKGMIRTGVGTMVGIGLMKPTAQMINDFD